MDRGDWRVIVYAVAGLYTTEQICAQKYQYCFSTVIDVPHECKVIIGEAVCFEGRREGVWKFPVLNFSINIKLLKKTY